MRSNKALEFGLKIRTRIDYNHKITLVDDYYKKGTMFSPADVLQIADFISRVVILLIVLF